MKVLVSGDFCPHYRVAKMVANADYSFFDSIKAIISEADYSIVNFECPVVEGQNIKPIKKAGPALRTDRSAVNAIKYAGFDCATLANNHFRDYGDIGCLVTIEELRKQQIDYVGGGANLAEAQQIRYKNIGNERLAIVNFCENEYSIATTTAAGSAPLDTVDNYNQITEARNNADYVLVIVHGGHEMYQLPSPRMKKLYRYFVNLGADAVVNHHQHCFSGYEYYDGKPIIYGLGNLCFDWEGKQNSIWNEGFIVTITFDKASSHIELHPYTQCNATPQIALLKDCDTEIFNQKLSQLNKIIKSDAVLQSHFDEWIESCYRRKTSIFASWNNRYLDIAARKRLLPIPMSANKAKSLLNHINCESHRDISIAVLQKHANK